MSIPIKICSFAVCFIGFSLDFSLRKLSLAAIKQVGIVLDDIKDITPITCLELLDKLEWD